MIESLIEWSLINNLYTYDFLPNESIHRLKTEKHMQYLSKKQGYFTLVINSKFVRYEFG